MSRCSLFAARPVQAAASKRRVHLGMVYDEEARKARPPAPPACCAVAPRVRAGAAQLWAERLRADDPDFKLGQTILKVDSRALQLARDAYDKEEGAAHATASVAPPSCAVSPSSAVSVRAGASGPRSREKGVAGGAGQPGRAAQSWSSGSWDAWPKGQKRERSWGDWQKKDDRKVRAPPRPVAKR